MKFFLTSFFLFLALIPVQAQVQKHVILETSIFADSLQAKKIQLLDVRTPEEFEAGHIERAVNYNYLNTENFKKQVDSLSKDQPVYLYCRSGNRSGKAAALLLAMGFSEVYDLKGGYLGWTASKSNKDK